jgi:spore coat assembly protein
MGDFKVGDIVARKSYGNDVYFRISDISVRSDESKVYLLRGILYRIFADSNGDDLVLQHPKQIQLHMKRGMSAGSVHRPVRGFLRPPAFFLRVRGRSGKILHIDSSSDYLDMCLKYYREANITVFGRVIPESEQPRHVGQLLASSGADILIVTGHDSIKKDTNKLNSLDSYRNSRYYIQSVTEARRYEPSLDRLCIFAGACQSYYEGIMEAGANFASSPGRILIHALDPAKVGDRVALTDSRAVVTPQQIASITQSGSKGIGGVRTRGHFKVE